MKFNISTSIGRLAFAVWVNERNRLAPASGYWQFLRAMSPGAPRFPGARRLAAIAVFARPPTPALARCNRGLSTAERLVAEAVSLSCGGGMRPDLRPAPAVSPLSLHLPPSGSPSCTHASIHTPAATKTQTHTICMTTLPHGQFYYMVGDWITCVYNGSLDYERCLLRTSPDSVIRYI